MRVYTSDGGEQLEKARGDEYDELDNQDDVNYDDDDTCEMTSEDLY